MPRFTRPAAESVVACAALVGLTVLSYELHFNLATVALLLMIVVVLVSRLGSFFSSVLASIIAAICLENIASPAFSFRVDDPLDAVSIVAFLITSLIIARLMSTVREQAEEALSSVSFKVIEAEEQERRRIASNLHEGIGQRVTLLAIEVDQLKSVSLSRDDVRNRLDALRTESLEILTEVKTLAHELYSPRLEYLGIAEVIHSFCVDLALQQKIEVDFRGDHLPRSVPLDVSLCLFRVAQEALHNGVEHSGVQQFHVQLHRTADVIRLTVSDCGVGFNLESAKTGRGLGLLRMQERLKLVNGSLLIDSQLKRGTTIHACVPVSLRNDSVGEDGARGVKSALQSLTKELSGP